MNSSIKTATTTNHSPMDLDDNHSIIISENVNDDNKVEEEEEEFVKFIEKARLILCPPPQDGGYESPEEAEDERQSGGPGWSWIASRVLKTCISYSSGVTPAILLSELSQAWNEQRKIIAPRKRPECISQLKKKHKRAKLSNTVTIDTIYEKNYLSLDSVLEAVVVDTFKLPGTNICMITLGDFWSSNTIDLYLHRKFYDLVSPDNGILKKGMEIFLTGCYLRISTDGAGFPRLLPTEYLVVLLDEEKDDDAMLLGAQFCSDSFSSISLNAASEGIFYSLYARIESIGNVENLEKCGGIKRIQITLVDNDGVRMNFLLWGEQVMLANVLSIGSMLAIDRPFIANSSDDLENGIGVCLEYGSVTQLYLVPFVRQGEQVSVALTPNRFKGSRVATPSGPTQCLKVSQMTLPCDSQGSVDFSNYPFQSFINDLYDKMTGISIYGVVTDIFRETNTEKSVFSLRLQDSSGTISVKLHFSESWSLRRLSLGHTVFICGLTCYKTKQKRLEARWFENDTGTSFVNLSCLPAILNSSCLHKLSCLADLSKSGTVTHICRVWLDQVEHCHVSTRLSHAACGHFVKSTSGSVECEFCCCRCETKELRRTFQLKITVADESGKVFAWCAGQTASELLQISPDEFYELPEEEQVIYPCSLENEAYMIATVNCAQQDAIFKERVTAENDMLPWEITRALKL
ncbi:hypothetical protein RND81_14G092600 [Saponaria officinalis]|uniref:Nucleic acid-binding protein n=1 Tax=Saponaria officinalis TaxID=3572 RepID=A0AAW1GK27_SAPOF